MPTLLGGKELWIVKTMNRLCNRFNRMFPEYIADLDEINSNLGYYRVAIVDSRDNSCYWHYFTSCRDFNSWINGIVMD